MPLSFRKSAACRYRISPLCRKAFIPKQENEWEEPLSKREREIAELAARGLRNGEIAEMLHISEGTVKNHLKIVFRKLNIDRRSSLRGRLR